MAVFHKIMIANDHAGYEMKKKVVAYLEKNGIEYIDIGSQSTETVRYPHFASRVAHAVVNHTDGVDGGILICGTGVGMSIAANKFDGIRAALVNEPTVAQLTREHNDSNILCLGGKIIGEFVAERILDKWLNTEFIGGRHIISVEMMKLIEQHCCEDPDYVPDLDWKPDWYDGPTKD